MSTRPAEITTPYGWTELFDAIRATRAAIRWIDDRIEHYQDLRDGRQPNDTNDAAAARRRRPDLTVDDVITALWTFIDNRAEQRRAPADSPASTPSSDARTGTQPPTSTEPEKGSETMHPDEQRRRDALIAEEHERQQRDLQSDGVLDGDYDREPGDGGTADITDSGPDLEG